MSTTTAPLPVFRVVKHVTRPLLKMELGKEYFVRFTGKIYLADAIAPTRNRKAPAAANGEAPAAPARKMEPPMLADVDDLVHGNRPSQIIVNAVLASELEKKYTEGSYVGRCFRLIKSQLQGKAYANFEIAEIEIEGQPAPAPAKGKK